jgi:TolA-binding protein
LPHASDETAARITTQPTNTTDNQHLSKVGPADNQNAVAPSNSPPSEPPGSVKAKPEAVATKTDETGPNSQPATQTKNSPATLMSDEGERELFRLGAIRPAPYNFSGTALHAGFGTTATPSSARSGHISSGSEERTEFADAMRAYVDGNYDEAIELLRRVLQVEPEAPDANFYLGVMQLLKGRPDQCFDPLKAAASGHTRWAQPAHYYLAKAYLQTRDLASAEVELKAAAAITGNLTASARADLASVQALRSREGR